MFSPLRHTLTVSVALLLLSLAACQGNHPATPAAPTGSSSPDPTPAAAPVSIPDSVWEADLQPGQGLFGINELVIDVDRLSARLEPVRMAAAIGDSYDVDIYQYLRQSPCGDCLQVQGLGYTGSEVEVQLAAKHPFTFGPRRYDLHVFDVRGTLIPLGGTAVNAGLLSDMAGANTAISGDFGVLVNAEGYSSFFTEQVKPYLGLITPQPTGTIFPFKTFFRDLAPTNYDPGSGTFNNLQFPEGHNTMAMGEGFEPGGVKYRIRVNGNSELRFLFLLDAAYGASSTRQTRLSPKYFLPEFHRKDPFEVQMEIIGSQLVSGRSTDIAQAVVTVRDWQGDLPANTGFGPDSAASTIKAVSSVESMEFFVQGVTAGAPQVKLRGTDFTGDVLPNEYWTTYQATFSFTNTALASPGDYYAVVAVRDALYGSGEPNPVFAVTREFTSGQPPQVLTDITTYAVQPVEVLELPVDCPGPMGPTFNSTVLVAPPGDGTFNQGKNFQFSVTNIQLSGTSLAPSLDRIELDQDYDGNPFNFSANNTAPLTGVGPTIGTITSDFSAIAPLAGPNPNHQVGIRVVDSLGNCNYTTVTITLWPPVTCPGVRGPSFTYAATNAPQPQGNNTTFQVSNMVRGGQTAITAIAMTFPGYPAVPAKNIPVPMGAEPYNFAVNENFSDPGFGTFGSTTNVQTVITATDAEGNCSTQSVSVDVQIGVPAPSFELIQNPFPAEPVVHGAMVQFAINNVLTPGSTILDITADPSYSGNPVTFNPVLTATFVSGNNYQVQYDWRNTAYLPTPGAPMNFAVRVRNTSSKETIITEPVQLANNQAPTAAWQSSAPTTGAVGSPVSVTSAMVTGNDPDGTIQNYRISWGDATADYVGNLSTPASHTYAASGNFTMTLYARDNGYGPTNGPAPLPGSREGTGVTRNISITTTCLGGGFWCEDFESTTNLGLPTGWVNVNALSSQSTWGVKQNINASPTPNTPLGAGQVKSLEESGTIAPGTSDVVPTGFNTLTPNQGRVRWGVFSPPITIPNDGFNYTFEMTHRYRLGWGQTLGGNWPYVAANVYVKAASGATDPGATESGGAGTMQNLSVLSNGPGWNFTAPVPSDGFCTPFNDANGDPFAGSPNLPTVSGLHRTFGHVGSLPASSWMTSTFNLNAYKGQTVRLYFVYGHCWVYSSACWLGQGWNIDNWWGWKIDRVRILQS